MKTVLEPPGRFTLKTAREAANMTQGQLGALLGVSPGTIHRWERSFKWPLWIETWFAGHAKTENTTLQNLDSLSLPKL